MTLRGRAFLMMLSLALPGVAAASAPSERDVDEALAEIYGPYARKPEALPDWERLVWSQEMRGLIDEWQGHIGGELTGLNDYGWFCACQDWDWKHFSWKRVALSEAAPDRLEVFVRVEPGWERRADQRLLLVREQERWLIDDLIDESEPDGIKAALRREISEPVDE